MESKLSNPLELSANNLAKGNQQNDHLLEYESVVRNHQYLCLHSSYSLYQLVCTEYLAS